MRVTISRMRSHAPFEPIDTNTCVWGGVHDVINRAIVFENRPKGFGAGRPGNKAFPIHFAGRPYNTLTLPCERVIDFVRFLFDLIGLFFLTSIPVL